MDTSNAKGMERPIKLWEFAIGIITLLITLSVMIYNRGTLDAENQIDINNLKIELRDLKQNYLEQADRMNQKVDKISDNVNDIKVLIQNKQDRKN